MSIRVVLRDGVFHPIDPIPPDWPEGIEVQVNAPGADTAPESIDPWRTEIEALASEVGLDDLGPLRAILDAIDRESKEDGDADRHPNSATAVERRLAPDGQAKT